MIDIKIAVRDNRAALLSPIDLVAGTVGQKCKFYFDENWQSLHKTVVYKLGSTVIASETIEGDECIVPPKVFMQPKLPLEIGVTACNSDKSIVIATIWCQLGMINESAFEYATAPNVKVIYDGGVIV